MRAIFVLGIVLSLCACADVETPELSPETDTHCAWGMFCFTTTRYADGHGVTVDFSYDGPGAGRYLMVINTAQRAMEGSYEDRIELILDRSLERRILDLVAAPGADFFYDWQYTVHPTVDPPSPSLDDYAYSLPFDATGGYPVLQGPGGDGAGAHATHRGAQTHAIDWALPLGTEILAARDGVVVLAYDGSRLRWHGHENLVIVSHSDGTYAWYGHLLPDGARVAPGDRVAAGDVIGLSGNSGYSSEPHLHFQISIPTPGGEYAFETLPVRFRE